jgi:hypothetical protein
MAEELNLKIELSTDRVVSFTDRGKAITYTLQHITRETWLKFYEQLAFRTQRGSDTALDPGDAKAARTDQHDLDTPAIQLVTENVTKVEGYTLSDGRDLMQLPNWKERLPAGHRAYVGRKLGDVRVFEAPNDGAAFVIDPEFEVVNLRALWGSVEAGKMLEHGPLVHRMKPVSIEQQRRANRARSQSIVVGGSRNDLTIFPNANRVFAEIYDELIVSVDGYTVEGKDLDSPELIKRYMDTHHKVAAAMLLFRAPEATEE